MKYSGASKILKDPPLSNGIAYTLHYPSFPQQILNTSASEELCVLTGHTQSIYSTSSSIKQFDR